MPHTTLVIKQEMGEQKRESKTRQILFVPLADSFRQKSPVTSTSLLCSGSGLKEWVVITAEANRERRRVEEKTHK